jgi:dipeptidyl aminopeptidase/acylaminoacyl peptidase
MARKLQDIHLDSKEARKKLKASPKPYWTRVERGKTIGSWGDHLRNATFSPDGNHLLVANDDGTANILRVSDMYPLVTLKGDGDQINGGSFSPDGQRVVTAGDGGSAMIWNARTGSRDSILGPVSEDAVTNALFSPDGSRVVTFSGIPKHAANVWNSSDGTRLAALVPPSYPKAAAFSSDGKQVTFAQLGCSIVICNVADGKTVKQFPDMDDRFSDAVAFSPDRTRAVFGLDDGTIRIRSCVDGNLLATLKGHRNGVLSSIAVSPDGKAIVSAGYGGRICIWHLTAA